VSAPRDGLGYLIVLFFVVALAGGVLIALAVSQ
jgi:hypothetical protein